VLGLIPPAHAKNIITRRRLHTLVIETAFSFQAVSGYPPPHLVEEVQQNRDVDRAFLAASGCFRQREHNESLAVRRQIQVRSHRLKKLLVRP
jgi:hypothetical protein